MKVLVAELRANVGMEVELSSALEALVPLTRSEPGARAYAIHRAVDDGTRFLVYETYADQAALERHLAAPYVQAFLGRCGELLAGEPNVRVFDRVTGFSDMIKVA